MNIKSSALILIIVVCGLTALLYFAVLSPLYQHGAWGADLSVLIVCELLMLGGFTGMTGVSKDGSPSVQDIARLSVIYKGALAVLALTVIHTAVCILSPVNLNVPYWILMGIIVIFFAIKLFAVNAGATLQERHEAVHEARQQEHAAVVSSLSIPTMMLTGAINATDAPVEERVKAATAVKSVAEIVGSFSSKRVVRNQALIESIGNWDSRLVQMKSSLPEKNSSEALGKIVDEARECAALLHNLYMNS